MDQEALQQRQYGILARKISWTIFPAAGPISGYVAADPAAA